MSSEIIEEIRNWKLEAKLEENTRYFYYTKAASSIENGTKCFVIGRKGTGKTAIAEYFSSINDANIFTVKLSF